MSSAVNVFIRKRSRKCLAQKVARFGSPGWIPARDTLALQKTKVEVLFYLLIFVWSRQKLHAQELELSSAYSAHMQSLIYTQCESWNRR